MFDRLLAQKLTGRQMAVVASSRDEEVPEDRVLPAEKEETGRPGMPAAPAEVLSEAFGEAPEEADEVTPSPGQDIPQDTVTDTPGEREGIEALLPLLGTLRQPGWEKTAVSMGASDSDMVFLRGLSLLRSGLYSEAIDRLEEVLDRAPEQAMAHFYLGRCHNLLGDPVAAEVSIRNAVELSPDNPEYLTELAIVLEKLSRNSEASACYRRAGAIRKASPGNREGQ
jgi:tetratricopeptide (TPR) repeat protein